MSKPKRRQGRDLKVIWSSRALANLRTIGRYISAHDPTASKRWVEKLIAAARKAGEVPNAGRMVPEVRRPEIRERIVRHYRVMYCVHEEHVEVLAVYEGHQQFPLDAVPDEE